MNYDTSSTFYLIFFLGLKEIHSMCPAVVDIYTDYSIWYKTHNVIIINKMENTDYYND